jgi:hypothetical protein
MLPTREDAGRGMSTNLNIGRPRNAIMKNKTIIAAILPFAFSEIASKDPDRSIMKVCPDENINISASWLLYHVEAPENRPSIKTESLQVE